MSRTVEILDRLIGFETVSARSNLALIDYVEDLLRNLGAEITRLPDPTGEKAGLFASIGPAGDGVLLSAHSDVVPVEGQDWTRDPFRLSEDEGRLYGRGTTDMKGFLAAMLAAAEDAAGRDLREPLKLAISYDEEVGCVGAAHMIGDMTAAIGRPRACIVGEPTEMRVAVGHKGKRSYLATFKGEAGHSALAPRFRNALYAATDFVTALRGVQAEIEATGARDDAYDIPYTTLHVGKMGGGMALNIVPDHAEVLWEFRHLAADDPDALFGRIRAAAPEAAFEPHINYPGLDTAEGAEVAQWAGRLAGNAAPTKVAFGTEGGLFDGLGVPTVVCGPGSMAGQGHKADEFVSREQLAACDAMLGRLVEELAG